jgi:hypothetical protein
MAKVERETLSPEIIARAKELYAEECDRRGHREAAAYYRDGRCPDDQCDITVVARVLDAMTLATQWASINLERNNTVMAKGINAILKGQEQEGSLTARELVAQKLASADVRSAPVP